MPQPRAIVPDGGIRAGLNTYAPGAVPTTIPKCRFVVDDTGVDCVSLSVDATHQLKGVSMQDIAPAVTGDIQIAGKTIVEAGAAYNKGDALGSDSTGRAIAVSSAGQYVGAIAAEAAGAAGEFHEAELV